ncbi:cupin domain-containing protein [Granulicoccus sp. GXG6511]|uniref:cupin domain-containing protein n=1 Tax=Granulicoccus sp. GXG6511 TaxID=3381351 RepID=UPI003D7DC5E9
MNGAPDTVADGSAPRPAGYPPLSSDQELFSLGAAEELITRRGLRTPFLRMVKDGTALPRARFTSAGGVGATIDDQVDDAKVRQLFAGGATAVLQGLHRTWAPINEFVRALAVELGHSVQANAYVTPPANQGFSAHYDVHDVFVVQVHGEKEWHIHRPVHEHPLRDEPWTSRAGEVREAAAQPADLTLTLRPGDVLYLPRGFIHSARALGGVTVHLTLGVHSWTRHHLAHALTSQALATVAKDPWVRSSLDPGVTVGDTSMVTADIARVRTELVAALQQIPDADIAAAMATLAADSMRPGPTPVFSEGVEQ